jgi:hypothetical protein
MVAPVRYDREAIAKEMFPAEYAAIDDDHPMDPYKVAMVDAEIANRSDRDRTLTIAGDVLAIISGYGGETIIAGPAMIAMAAELTALVEKWRTLEWTQ